MSNGLISVVIVTTGNREFLLGLLDSLQGQSLSPAETIVIDNSADPSFGRWVLAAYPGIRLFIQPENLYYCHALNRGIGASSGEFVLCLNDDLVLEKRFLEEAVKGFFEAGRIGAVSGKVFRSDARTIDSTGLFLSPWRTAVERGYGRPDNGRFDKKELVFGASGAVAFYRRMMLEDIKTESGQYFDETYHIFYEDLDVAWRAQRRGWKACYIPGAVAYHLRGGTVRRGRGTSRPYARRYLDDRLHLDLIKNRYLTIIRNESAPGLLRYLACILLHDIVMWTYVLFFRPRLAMDFLCMLPLLKRALQNRLR